MKRLLTLLLVILLLFSITGCSEKRYVKFEEFDQYKEELHEIATLALELYRTEEGGVRIYFNEENTEGIFSGNAGNFEVDEGLSSLLIDLKKSNIPCQLQYIIIGDSFVTFTREGVAYAIMYSEDDVRPTGTWKYDDTDLQVYRIEDCWYEISAPGLGVYP